MNDDLNTSIALSVMFELASLGQRIDCQKVHNCETLVAIDNMFMRLGGDVLGIVKEKYQQQSEGNEAMLDKLVAVLIEQRKAAKEKKDFATADALRKRLRKLGLFSKINPAE